MRMVPHTDNGRSTVHGMQSPVLGTSKQGGTLATQLVKAAAVLVVFEATAFSVMRAGTSLSHAAGMLTPQPSWGVASQVVLRLVKLL